MEQRNELTAQQPSMVLLEENIVDGVGRFSVYSNGHIRILFDDRTCLEMMADLSKRLGSSWQVFTILTLPFC